MIRRSDAIIDQCASMLKNCMALCQPKRDSTTKNPQLSENAVLIFGKYHTKFVRVVWVLPELKRQKTLVPAGGIEPTA